MSFDVEQYVHYQIANALVLRYPYPHFYIKNIFPEDFYRALLENLPGIERYKRLDQTGTVPRGSYPERYICSIVDLEDDEATSGEEGFWTKFSLWIHGISFQNLFLWKFREEIMQRFGDASALGIDVETRLVRDFSNYSISPHTDTPRKLVTLLFYLAKDESLSHLGTSVYVPSEPDFRCEGTKHHKFSDFKKINTAHFLPNSVFGFFKTNNAFHGVEPIKDIGIERNVLLYNIYTTATPVKNRNQGGEGKSIRHFWPFAG